MINRLNRWLRFNLMYFSSPPWDTGISPPELLEFIRSHPPGKALDLGCGTGTNLVSLAQAGWSIVGIDFAYKAVGEARKKLRAAGLNGTVIRGDVTRVDFPGNPFDLVLDIGCYHSLPGVSREMYRHNLTSILSPEGTFLIYLHLIDITTNGVGVTEEDIGRLSQQFTLKSRRDSLDRFGRQAVWLEMINRS